MPFLEKTKNCFIVGNLDEKRKQEDGICLNIFNFIILKIFIIDREKSFYFLYNEMLIELTSLFWRKIGCLDRSKVVMFVFFFFFYHQKNKLKIGIITDDVKTGEKKKL